MLKSPGAWRATMMYAHLLGSSPTYGYRILPDSSAVRLATQPGFLAFPAGQGPGRRTPFKVKADAAIDMLWHGNAIGVAVRSPMTPWPIGWVGVAADACQVAWVDPYDYSAGRIYQIGSKIFSEGDILHWEMPGEVGALRGLGVWETQGQTLALAEAQQDQAFSVSSNHGVPTGLLYTDDPDVTDTELAASKAAWLASQRDRTIAALGGNTKFQPVAWSPEAGQMVEARQFSLTDLENTFMLPVGWLGGMNSARQYSNIEQDAVNLIKFSALAGLIPAWEQTNTQQMPRNQFAQNNLDAILRGDTKTRYEAHAIASGGRGWMTPDEIREIEDRQPLGGAAAELEPTAQPAPIQATAEVDQSPAIEGTQ